MHNHFPFILPQLPYSINSLEPYIDEETVYIHHFMHEKKYIDTLNSLIEPYPQFYLWTLEKLIRDTKCLPSQIQQDVRNNAGGVYNHYLYFNSLTDKLSQPNGKLLAEINNQFGSLYNLKEQLKASATSLFGSGYAVLAKNKKGKLSIRQCANQDTVLGCNLMPVLIIDMWEHSYYLKYQNQRNEYFDNWFKVINWDVVENIYNMYNFT